MKNPNYLIVCMGVSGSGKTTLARFLAEKLSIEFLEADDFHSPENIEHMALGHGLTDEMRGPWMTSMCEYIQTSLRPCVLACSGLRRAHRNRFRGVGRPILFLHLHGEFDVILDRMKKRVGHFMPFSLLESQFESLEPTLFEDDVVAIDVNGDRSRVFLAASKAVDAFLKNTKNHSL